jgi:DNA-binding transcriptional LysR family regulator
MELRQLQHFVAAARTEHFTRAARRLNIVQSALSNSIRSLETELGAQLFVRTTRTVRLTAAGRALLEKAEVVLDSVEGAREAVRAVAQGQAGRLTIGTVQSLPAFLNLPSILADFHGRYPQVEVRLMQAGAPHLIEKLRNGRLDFAFLPAFEPRDDIEARVIACEELVAVAAAGADWPCDGPVRLDTLSSLAFVDFERDLGTRRLADQAFERAFADRRVVFEVSDLGTLLNLVEQGLGVALVPESVALARQARLSRRPIAGVDLCWEIVIAHHPIMAQGMVSTQFLELLESRPVPA